MNKLSTVLTSWYSLFANILPFPQFKAGNSCLPSDPPVYLTVSEQQGVTVRKDDLMFDSAKPVKSSTRRDDPTAARRSSSLKQATKCSAAENGCPPGATFNDQFFLIGLPPPVVKADPNKKVQTVSQTMQTQCSQVNSCSTAATPILNGSIPFVLCGSQEGPSSSLNVMAGSVITAVAVKKKNKHVRDGG